MSIIGYLIEGSLLSLAQLQEVPLGKMVLLVGPPGAGKSTFCQQAALQSLAMDRSIIFVTTEYGSSDAERALRERGLREIEPGLLSFVDAYNETVGVPVVNRPDTVCADCNDLSSIDIAISKLTEQIGRKDILLVFDSLTSPYLFNGLEILRFIKQTLSKFAAKGNSVLTCMDTGCGKEEDLGAMMSVADGILRMEMKESQRILNVVKHPMVEPARIDVPIEPRQPQVRPPMNIDWTVGRRFGQSLLKGKVLRTETGDFVNLFWPNLAHWSCILWDPKGFPTMFYEINKYETAIAKEAIPVYPWSMRLGFSMLVALQSLGLFLPKSFSKVKDMKKMVKVVLPGSGLYQERSSVLEYLEGASKTDEHHFRMYENCDCVVFENIGTTIASHIPPTIAGGCKMAEKDGREWNAIETKCLGLGDPYCEFKVVPGEIDELKPSLEKDSALVEKIHERLMERLIGFLLDGKPLVERPKLGSDVHLHVFLHGMGLLNLVGERYRRAQMMGAARSAKKIGERLMEAGLSEDEALKRVLNFLDHCKVGKVTLGETVRIKENCEVLRTTMFIHEKQPCCFFTTGFLNGLFSAVKNQHVREVRCVAAGDPYCEWEFR
jgi:predicted hydrocarbon binding protein/KaiC/GvpD/RAD55 family RecA-like ATPase